MRPVLTPAEIADLSRDLPLWAVESDGKAIRRDLEFKDFKQAFAFMTKVADIADLMDHHPEWSNIYNRVYIRLTTHDSNGLTLSDVKLAQAVDLVTQG